MKILDKVEANVIRDLVIYLCDVIGYCPDDVDVWTTPSPIMRATYVGVRIDSHEVLHIAIDDRDFQHGMKFVAYKISEDIIEFIKRLRKDQLILALAGIE